MSQSQQELSYRYRPVLLQRSSILQRYPVLAPCLLLSCSIALGIASFFSDSLFPVLALIGVPTNTFCLSLACISGIVGVLVGIITVIERADRAAFQATAISQRKEHGYANRN
jgi:hypothetical protein